MRHVGIMKSTQSLYVSHQQKGKFFKIVKFTFLCSCTQKTLHEVFISSCRSGCFHLPFLLLYMYLTELKHFGSFRFINQRRLFSFQSTKHPQSGQQTESLMFNTINARNNCAFLATLLFTKQKCACHLEHFFSVYSWVVCFTKPSTLPFCLLFVLFSKSSH